MSEPILQVSALTAGYGRAAVLHGLDFDVAAGGVTTLLGANGAGKTTTLRAISGMIDRRGHVMFEGNRIDALAVERIARLGIAHVPDGRGTFGRLTVDENLRLGAYRRTDRGGMDRDRDMVFGYFPILARKLSLQAGTLSGGEQQMLAIGRALMLRPRLLLLDEPSFGLAPLVVAEIFAIMRTINTSEGVGILIVEQNANLALDLADQACLIETGRIVVAGSSVALRSDPTIQRSYLGV